VPGAGFEPATSGHMGVGHHCSPDYEYNLGPIGLTRNPQDQEIDYKGLREEFVAWLRSKGLNKYYAKGIVSSLDKHIGEKRIKESMDIVNVFANVERGRHELIPALHALLNFAKLKGFDRSRIEMLKEAIPKREIGVDLKIPSEDDIISSLRIVDKVDLLKHKVAFNLALDSGLRLTETVKLIEGFRADAVEKAEGFYVACAGMFRKSKVAYYGFFTEYTMRLLAQLSEEEKKCLTDKNAAKYVQNLPGVVCCKYLRKFAFDKMIELGVPESAPDFIEGRTPKTIGAKHYMILLRQAKQYYPRYVEYIGQLRQKAIN
ncbi:MAG: integrase, partial [Candidatus Bathyarchaeota archaeon]|nr:integrase [Candidatus Bathyarchaeota archaeon]